MASYVKGEFKLAIDPDVGGCGNLREYVSPYDEETETSSVTSSEAEETSAEETSSVTSTETSAEDTSSVTSEETSSEPEEITEEPKAELTQEKPKAEITQEKPKAEITQEKPKKEITQEKKPKKVKLNIKKPKAKKMSVKEVALNYVKDTQITKENGYRGKYEELNEIEQEYALDKELVKYYQEKQNEFNDEQLEEMKEHLEEMGYDYSSDSDDEE